MYSVEKLPADNLIACFNESSNDCVKVLDPDSIILSFNDQGYKIMEIDSPEQVLGKNWLEFWTGDMKELAAEAFKNATLGKLGYFEGFCPTLKGTPRWWQVTVVPLMNDHQEVQWILSMSRDVTELHDLRKKVKELSGK